MTVGREGGPHRLYDQSRQVSLKGQLKYVPVRWLRGTKVQAEDRAYADTQEQGTAGPFKELYGMSGA